MSENSTGSQLRPIPLFEAGSEDTPFSASRMNELVVALNALMNAQVQRGESDGVFLSRTNVIYQIARASAAAGGGSSVGVYKITSISNISSDYIAAKTVTFDNSNAETLGAAAVNIALPWQLRAAQISGTRTPAYAVNQYIVVAEVPDGAGVVVSGAQLTLVDLGIGRIDIAGTARFRIRTGGVHDNYLTCETWDGTTGGGVDVLIAKNPKCRHIASETKAGVTITYTYSAETGYLDGKRVASDGTNSEKQVVVEPYLVGDDIYADRPLRGTGVSVSGTPLVWMDTNRDGRAWCRKNNQA